MTDTQGDLSETALGTTPVDTGGKRLTWVKIILGAAVAAFALYFPYANNAENNQVVSQVLYLAIAAMGLNLLTGFNGQVSIGHGAFFGLGAFTTAILVVDYGWYIETTIPIAAMVSAILGILIGFPALRVKGAYLALLTLGLAVLFPAVVKKFVKGDGGVPLLQPTSVQVQSTIDFLADDQYQYYVCLLVAALLFFLAWNLMRSRAGRAMIAVRDQEVAASTVGINVAGVKVSTFALSAAYAGVAGSLSVLIDGVADASNPITYFQRSIEFLVAVVIGGAATIIGPFLGAALLVFVQRRSEGTEQVAPAILGGALIVITFLAPDGLVGLFRRAVARVTRARSSGSGGGRDRSTPAPAGATAVDPPSTQENPS